MRNRKIPAPLFALPLVAIVVTAAALATGTRDVSAGADNDGDGLPNSWENGDTLVGGVDYSAPPYNADPNHKDVFIEVDYMKPAYKPKLPCTSLNKSVKMFANAPLNNPDGDPGVTLHIDAGKTCAVGNFDLGDGSQAGTPKRPDPLTQELFSCNNLFKEGFDDGDVAQMPAARRKVFHHVLFAGDSAPANADDNAGCPGLLGIARGLPSRQSIVFVDSHEDFPPERQIPEILGSFLHEFGHHLGLTHGGEPNSGNPYKPNHLSLMNYNQAGGIWTVVRDERTTYDYQRRVINSLNENSLNEAAGLDGASESYLAKFMTVYSCPNEDVEVSGPSNASIDWNCNNNPNQTNVSVDIDGGGAVSHSTTVNEWAIADFGGGAGGQIGDREGFDESAARPLPPQLEMTIHDRLRAALAAEEAARRNAD